VPNYVLVDTLLLSDSEDEIPSIDLSTPLHPTNGNESGRVMPHGTGVELDLCDPSTRCPSPRTPAVSYFPEQLMEKLLYLADSLMDKLPDRVTTLDLLAGRLPRSINQIRHENGLTSSFPDRIHNPCAEADGANDLMLVDPGHHGLAAAIDVLSSEQKLHMPILLKHARLVFEEMPSKYIAIVHCVSTLLYIGTINICEEHKILVEMVGPNLVALELLLVVNQHQPWPPPDELRLMSCDAELRPTQWSMFIMAEWFFVRSYCGRLWKPPWPIQICQQIRFMLTDLVVSWKNMMISMLGAMVMCVAVDLRPIPWPSFSIFHEFTVQWCCVFDRGKCLRLGGLHLLLSVSMVGCALIHELVQQKCGGNCRCFMLEVVGQQFRVARGQMRDHWQAK